MLPLRFEIFYVSTRNQITLLCLIIHSLKVYIDPNWQNSRPDGRYGTSYF